MSQVVELTAPAIAAYEPVLNAISVDVEEHFQVSAFEDVVDRRHWDSIPSRVVANTERLLELFAEFPVHATFFVLGWIAERHPRLVARVAEAGHEIACHGYAHRLVYEQTPEGFAEELRRSKGLIEQAAGVRVAGYRAASFSITRDSLWALDILAEQGFDYDSSLFPVHHDRYGVPGMPRSIYRLRTPAGNSLIELPPSTVLLGPFPLPVAGGGYLRIFPAAVSQWAVRRLNRRERMPAVVYLHPWEVDPEQPRVRAGLKSRLRHYTGLRTTLPKLRRLLAGHAFGTMQEVIGRELDGATTVSLARSSSGSLAVTEAPQ